MDSFSLCEILKNGVDHAKIEIIGESVLGKPIYSVSFDFGKKECVLFQGAIHAREHITCDLLVKMIFEVSLNFEKYEKLQTPNIIFVPLANPDGADIVVHGISKIKNLKVRKFLKKINNNSLNFSLFKANANGVDLNTNFDARWGTGKENVFHPSTEGFVGPFPMSEPCTKALELLTRKVKPVFTVSYHSKGEVIYHDFFCKKEHQKRDKKVAKIVARATGYKLASSQNSSSGGFKDWCIQNFGIPAVTIEVGSERLSHPIGEKHLKGIFKKNVKILKKLGRIVKVCDGRKTKVYENCT